MGQAKGLGRTHRGAFAARGASDDANGSGAPSRARASAGLLALAAFALLALAPSAPASPQRPYATSFGAFTGANPQALTVDQSSGDVYAIDTANNTVVRFAPDGSPANFTAGPDSGTNILTGFSFDPGPAATEVAVDNSGGPSDGNVYVANSSGGSVKVFASDGTPLGALNGSGTPAGSYSEACGVAVDQASGDLYVGDFGNRVWRYSPSGATVVEGDYSGGIATSSNPCQVAADSGHVYVLDWGASGEGGALVRFRATDFATGAPPSPSGATVDPNSRSVAVDPATGDVYANDGNHVAVYHQGGALFYSFGSSTDFGANATGVAVKSGGQAYVSDRHAGGNQVDVYGAEAYGFPLTVVKAGAGAGTVTSSPAGIDCGSSCEALFNGSVTLTAAPDPGFGFKDWTGCASTAGVQCTVSVSAAKSVTATFSAKPAISSSQATGVGAESAKLNASLNPDGLPTTYHFEYTEDADFQAHGFDNATRKPVPDAAAGAGLTKVTVSTSITGLLPATTYHFRLVAVNPLGSTEGPAVTLTTYSATSGFLPCANDGLRTGPGARLPDCRAYEQASPVDKNGSDASGNPRTVEASINGDAVTFNVLGGVPGAVGAQELQNFVARRGAGNWATQGMMPPAAMGNKVELSGWTPDLNYAFSDVRDDENSGYFAFARQDTAAGTFGFVHTYASTPGASLLTGASSDGSKVFFDNGEAHNAQITPDAAPGVRNFYAWDSGTGTVSLAGQTPAAPDTECGAGGPACVVPASGSRSGAGHDFTQPLHMVSRDGGQALFNAGDDDQLYARLNATGPDASTVQVSGSQRTDCADHDPCNGTPEPDPVGMAPDTFQYATPSGSKVLFTSSEELTDDANTAPPATAPSPAAIVRADVADGSNAELDFIPQKAQDIDVDAGHIYWTDPEDGTIGRAEIGGGNPEPDFIAGLEDPRGVAVDATHIYWTEARGGADGAGTIGRADLPANSGEPPANPNRSCVTGADNPQGMDVGVGADTHIYWANAGSKSGHRSIGRANLDCTDANQTFLTADINEVPQDVAVDAQHLYYADRIPEQVGGRGYIVRHNLDGSGKIYRQSSEGTPTPQSISLDANHVYWTTQESPNVFLRDLDLESSGNIPTGTDGVLQGLAVDGSHLYWSSVPGPTPNNPGSDLYAWDSSSHQLTDLAPDTADANGAEVQGVIGASDDGSYVYFVANADLDGPGGPASAGNCVHRPDQDDFTYEGDCNLYLWHAGEPVRFIAEMNAGSSIDPANWARSPRLGGGGSRSRTGLVSADGHSVIFSSVQKLTSYDNGAADITEGAPQKCGEGSVGQPCAEFYRYNVEDGLRCVSCNPNGAAPSGAPTVISILQPQLGPRAGGTPLGRFFSADGERVFFETPDKLVAADTNGDQGCPIHVAGVARSFSCLDVYEWEAPGSGSCTGASPAYSGQDGGCLYLISTGTSSEASYFAGASASGEDAFFFTRDALVPQDTDQLVDIYDARVDGGLAAQHKVTLPGCVGEACRGAGASSPSPQGAGSAVFSGPGNETRPQRRDCNAAAKRAQKLTLASKNLRRRAKKVTSPVAAKSLLHQSAALAKRADQLSQNAKRCRSANRRAAR
jgi:hypothetical protein